MPNIILSDTSASVSELKKNPMATVSAGDGYPVAILNRNQPAFYCVPAELYERMLDALDDQELVKLVTERSNQPLHDVDLDSYLGTVAKLAMRQPFVLFKGLTFQKLCLPGAFRPGDHHNKMLRPGLCVVHASPQYL